ncbi:MAG TPA: hypothetical protein VF533_23750 [Solirubrobacteraceae bacterium]|jgi:hypothetical protein
MARSRVRLPPGVRAPYTVYRNGVRQQEGADYVLRGGALEFADQLAKDQISKKRWFLGAWGVGTYRQDDSIDVAWTAADGTPRIAHRLDFEPVAE